MLLQRRWTRVIWDNAKFLRLRECLFPATFYCCCCRACFKAACYIFVPQDVNPRQLHLNITRTVSLVGNIAVDINVTYHLPGSTSSSGEVSLTYPREVFMRAGTGNVSVTVDISNDGFIKLGASFRAELTGVRLQSGGNKFCYSSLRNCCTFKLNKIGNKVKL